MSFHHSEFLGLEAKEEMIVPVLLNRIKAQDGPTESRRSMAQIERAYVELFYIQSLRSQSTASLFLSGPLKKVREFLNLKQ